MIEQVRAWARAHTEEGRYSPVGQAFHWIMAALVMFQVVWGFYTGMIGVGGSKIVAYQVHSAAGLPVLLLAIGRLGWRLIVPGPQNDADTQGVQTVIAHAIHWLFYAAFFMLPLSGWLMWSADAEPGALYLGGVIPWPQLPLDALSPEMRWQAMQTAESIHTLFVWMLTALIPLHVGAALKHHFWDRHDVLRGMLPEIPDEQDPQGGHRHRPRGPGLRTESGAG
jgi:cytochrome b561